MFADRLAAVQLAKGSALCVGLDPDPARLPQHLLDAHPLADAVIAFHRAIIASTHEVACAYKLNYAFYEALGADAHRVLTATLAALPSGVLMIADAKRGDIGNSARFYAQAIFEQHGADAITVAPYMGADAVTPFLQHGARAAFVLARTSNASAGEVQEVGAEAGGKPLYLRIVEAAQRWGDGLPGRVGFVASATNLGALRQIREAAPEAPLLVPGVGAQGGSAAGVMEAAHTNRGRVLVNSSRSILYANDGEAFAAAARDAAEALLEEGLRL